MKSFDGLIQSYLAANLNAGIVGAWLQEQAPCDDETLSALAEKIGADFLAGNMSFEAANGLLNDLMPLIGFESAPPRFWQYYVAFEDFETALNPNIDARAAIAAVASGVA